MSSVRAATGSWDPSRPTEGAYGALIHFQSGVFATAVYSGYAHFDSDELCGWIGEMGNRKEGGRFSGRSFEDELKVKTARNYGGAQFRPQPDRTLHQHFGPLIASCERADLRPLPTGVMIYGGGEPRFEPLEPPALPRVEVIDELYAAVVEGKAPRHDGAWGRSTLEVCLAILASAREHREFRLPL